MHAIIAIFIMDEEQQERDPAFLRERIVPAVSRQPGFVAGNGLTPAWNIRITPLRCRTSHVRSAARSRRSARWLAAVCRHAILLDDAVGLLGPRHVPNTRRSAYRPLVPWPQTETPASQNARTSIIIRAFLLFRGGGGQGRGRTADLPLFRIKDDRPPASMTGHLCCSRTVPGRTQRPWT